MLINNLNDRLQTRLQKDENWVKFALSFEGILIILLIISTVYLSLYILQQQAPNNHLRRKLLRLSLTPQHHYFSHTLTDNRSLDQTTSTPAGVKEYFIPLAQVQVQQATGQMSRV